MSKRTKSPPSFAALVQAYFTEYLTQQRALSPQTIAAYRDGSLEISSIKSSTKSGSLGLLPYVAHKS